MCFSFITVEPAAAEPKKDTALDIEEKKKKKVSFNYRSHFVYRCQVLKNVSNYRMEKT